MAEFDRRDQNLKTLNEADELQNKTIEALNRINKNAIESETVAGETIEELRRQANQINDLQNEVDDTGIKLKKSAQLQKKFDLWAFNWLGGKKNNALKEAAAEIQSAEYKQQLKTKEVYEQEKYSSVKRKWKSCGLVLVSDPSISADNIFDPKIQGAGTSWVVDYQALNVDAEGWTYSYDFSTLNKNGTGLNKHGFNTYVRRRKWKYTDKKSSDVNASIEERNNARKEKAKNDAIAASVGAKIGYVKRDTPITLTSSGLTSVNHKKSDDQALDEESKAGLQKLRNKDQQIDNSLEMLDETLGRLHVMSKAMNEQVQNSQIEIDVLDNKLQSVNEQQTVVNARLRHQLK